MSRARVYLLSDLVLLALLALTTVVILADVQPMRPYVVFLAACVVPGGALITRLRTEEGLTDLALAIGLSIGIEIAGSLVLTWSGWWHPEALGIVLGTGSLVLLLSDLFWGRHR
jgi:uncharacterized membrane protein